jgi:hypothetical protein
MPTTALLEARETFSSARPSRGFDQDEVPAGEAVLAFTMATETLRLLPDSVEQYDALRDEEVLALQRQLATQRRLIESRAALIAGQIARRSARELGSDGLAQRTGYRTPEEMIRVATGSSANDARRAVRVGVALDEAHRGGRVDQVTGEVHAPSRPWLADVSRAVFSGALSLDAADSIANGLGAPSATITTAMLADAAAALLAEAILPSGPSAPSSGPAPLDADRLYRLARDLRDEMDAAGIAVREEQRRAERALRIYQRPSGMSRLVWDMDPETAVIVRESYDQLTSPRRGGPRFVATSPDADRAERILRDDRTTEQLASDGFLELIRIAADTAPTRLIGLHRPSVRVLVPASSLAARQGSGRIEGAVDSVSIDSVSIETVERHACSDGIQAITFNAGGQPLDVGREQRLYTRRQRVALAARDGGCRWTGCDRPPSWTEAHHIKHWVRDRGGTDVADGILLCRHHHLLLHNNKWEITRDGADYWLVPPPSVDAEQRPIAMPSKSRALREMLRAT